MKKLFLTCELSLACLLTLTFMFMQSCNGQKTATDFAVEKIDSLFNNRYATIENNENRPGGAVYILKGDTVIFDKGYGIADLATGSPIDGNTFFNIASVSKQFTAMAILQLQEEGKLSVEDALSKYFPDFKADFFKRIKIKHLLSHSSGLPDLRPRDNRDFVLHATDMECIEFFKELDHLNFEPGSNYEYQNPTFQLCYAIIEKVSGEPFEEYMKKHIFTPAGMDETLYFEAERNIPRMAHGYITEDNGVTWKEYDYGEESFFATKADGGIYTSTHEFAKWEQALRNDILISDSLKQIAHSPVTTVTGSTYSSYQNRPYTSYGYGWFIEQKPGMPKKVYHTGDNGGFQIYAGRFPEKGILVLVFENRNDQSRWQMVEKIDSILKDAGMLD